MEGLSPFELKDQLIALASKEHKGEILNAGRGNPNFLAILPRKIFNLLGKFAIEESEFAYSYFHNDLGGFPQTNGLYTRFLIFLKMQDKKSGANEVLVYLSYAQDQLGLDANELLEEFVTAYLANNYPFPPRVLKNIEKIVKKYLVKEMCNNSLDVEFDIFPTEGGTAAMTYIFNSLKMNELMKAGDKIAIVTPIFTPYLEIPKLPEYAFEIVELRLDPKLNWQLSALELEKLKDPAIKLLCIVNPSNPSSTKMSTESIHQLKDLVNKDRHDLMIVTDDVYGTFSDEFLSCFAVLPYNTLLVYSYSKYFGATGWRLGTIALAQENIFQDKMRQLPTEVQDKINTRYSIMNANPQNLKFIDRLVADSRAVGLNHTAGISTPQQLQMALFSLNSLADLKENYKICCKELIRSRYNLLYTNLGIKPIKDCNSVDYYTLIDLKEMASVLFDDGFAEWFDKNNKVNDFLFALAKETGVVLMPGKGFGDITPTLRVSLANLQEYQYEAIGQYTKKILKKFHDIYTK